MVESGSIIARRCAPSCLLALLLIGAAPSALLHAQARFADRSTPVSRQRAGLAFDVLRERMVLVGGFNGRTGVAGGAGLRDTWEQEASGWVLRSTVLVPAVTDQATALAYDPARKHFVYVGLHPTTRQMETWRYDGRNWTRFVGLTNSPQPRQNHATAFDPVRGVMVLFGGRDATVGFLDTWEFDGLDWRQVAMTGPSARDDATMAFDGAQNRVVLFGGRGPSAQPLNDTWEWDGTAWRPLNPVNAPSARHSAGMAFDGARNQVVLFGGASGLPGTRLDDTWVWDGTNWTQRTPAARPAARNGHAITYRSDRQRVVLVAGDGTAGLLSDTWEWDGATWVETIASAPGARSDHAACFDANRGGVLIFGGKDATNATMADTWLWRAGNWRELSPGVVPPARSDHAMEFDAARGQAVMFGGRNQAGTLADTWIWNGVAWSQANPANVPPARLGHTMTFDPLRQVIVLFGGTGSSGTLDDVWEWNGSNWAARTPAVRPLARTNHGMAWDPTNRQILLFGGRTTTGSKLNDTWLYDGAAGVWTQRVLALRPAARDDFAMYHDVARQRVTINSGALTAGYAADTWDWNGSAWTLVFVFPAPLPRQGMTLTYDSVGRHAVLFGGLSPLLGLREETWLLTANPVAQVVAQGVPCAGASGSAVLTGFGSPTIGSSSFALELTSPTPTTIVPVIFLLAARDGSVTFGSCTLALDPSSAFYTTHRLQFGVGFASLALPIPPNASLRGAEFFAVAAYVDPPTQFFGLAFSRQARVVIGD